MTSCHRNEVKLQFLWRHNKYFVNNLSCPYICWNQETPILNQRYSYSVFLPGMTMQLREMRNEIDNAHICKYLHILGWGTTICNGSTKSCKLVVGTFKFSSPLKTLKGVVPQFFVIKSHILDSNGVWYWLFWSEGSINWQNVKILVPDLISRDLE